VNNFPIVYLHLLNCDKHYWNSYSDKYFSIVFCFWVSDIANKHLNIDLDS